VALSDILDGSIYMHKGEDALNKPRCKNCFHYQPFFANSFFLSCVGRNIVFFHVTWHILSWLGAFYILPVIFLLRHHSCLSFFSVHTSLY
jgi:hypothetical protein